ncbi:MAG: GTPase Era [Bacteroidetes bacterium]|nr:GTPase Era [Bacteroidota bacterium]
MAHKSGFVNILGNPNAGKSTLMNAFVGEKLSIITSKAQTTRHRIMGIVNAEDYQIVYSDTPGIVNPHYKLHESMMGFVMSALKDADVFLLVTDIGEDFKNQEILETVKDSLIPTIIIINKIDLSDQETVELKMKFWKEKFPTAEVIPVSALLKFNMEKVVESILDKLPDSPPYFPKDEISDKTMRFFASEIIREKIFENYQKEIPYACEVIVESYKEEPNIDKISATIFVERDSQKGIIIGHKGSALKKVGTEARIDMEEFLQKKVFLELHVKVNKDWRNNDTFLKRFGYEV